MATETPTSERTPEQWGSLYGSRRELYEDLTRRVEGLIKDLLRSEGIDVIQVDSRTKTVESFVEKIKRKSRTDENPFDSITDLIGIRVITYYLEDVELVGHLLNREFSVDLENSSDRVDVLAFDQFGYRSSHFVCALNDARSQLVEWQTYKGLSIEFQVRTALQHAWAAVSHKLEYKTPEEAPETLRRRLYRLSALFELADDQFSSLRERSAAATDAYRAEVGRGQLEAPIDASSLTAYWSLTDRLERLGRTLVEAGAIVQTDELGEDQLKRDHSDLVTVLKKHGLTTLAELDRFLDDESTIIATIRALVEVDDEPVKGSIEDLLTQVIIIDRDDSDRPGRPVYTEQASRLFLQVRAKLRIT